MCANSSSTSSVESGDESSSSEGEGYETLERELTYLMLQEEELRAIGRYLILEEEEL